MEYIQYARSIKDLCINPETGEEDLEFATDLIVANFPNISDDNLTETIEKVFEVYA